MTARWTTIHTATLPRRATLALFVLLAGIACRETGRVDAAALARDTGGPVLHVTILASPTDTSVPVVREALAQWRSELRRLGRTVQLDSGVVRVHPVNDSTLRAAGGKVWLGRGPAISRLRDALAGVPGDMIIVLSDSDLISYGLAWRTDSPGVVVLRRTDIFPLTKPNVLRNVVAHEFGHALGLVHNRDPSTLMCGRPASCRPSAFESVNARFFPLTEDDDAFLRGRWP